MRSEYEVSVIVTTYNSEWMKIVATLESIIAQKSVYYQIIVTDDSSENDICEKVKIFFDEKKFADYEIVKHEKNVGTVQNELDGVIKSRGIYCYSIAPGDVLYDENVLSDFFCYCKKNRVKMCFGDVVFFSYTPNLHIKRNIVNQPPWPYKFNAQSVDDGIVELLFCGGINGVSFFRETKTYKELLCEIKHLTTYVEDTTSAALALAKRCPVIYYERKVAFYDYGVGVSTKKDSKWDAIIYNDIKKVYEYISNNYENPFYKIKALMLSGKKKAVVTMYCILFHPICLMKIGLAKRKKKIAPCSLVDETRMKELFKSK